MKYLILHHLDRYFILFQANYICSHHSSPDKVAWRDTSLAFFRNSRSFFWRQSDHLKFKGKNFVEKHKNTLYVHIASSCSTIYCFLDVTIFDRCLWFHWQWLYNIWMSTCNYINSFTLFFVYKCPSGLCLSIYINLLNSDKLLIAFFLNFQILYI